MDNQQLINDLVTRSRAAQKIVEGYTQEQVDAIARMFAKVVFDNAEMFGPMAAEETRMGVAQDKINKCRGKSRIIWNSVKGKKTVGVINVLEDEALMEVAKPMGVVAALCPCTNPVVTPMCNAMFAIKARDTIIIAPHPRSKKCTVKLKELYDAELTKMGVPTDIFLVIEEPNMEATGLLMKEVDVILATGGAAMVKSAYSSGRPSYGVGPGNVQGIFDEGMDFEAEAKKAIASRMFDNGIICSCTQTMIAPASVYDKYIEAFKNNGACYIDDAADVAKIREAMFPGGVMNKNLVGQSVAKVAETAGVTVPADAKIIICKVDEFGANDVLSKEKMAPVMTAYKAADFKDCVAIAKANLLYNGAGHSCDLHSNNRDNIVYAGVELPVSRVLVNQICASQNGGSFSNSLSPTTTLGCGSWGNNSISENLTYYHLFNKARIAFEKKGWSEPSNEEIWGE